MLDRESLKAVAEQLMSGTEVVVKGSKYRVKRIGSGRLRTVRFVMDEREFQAIEQNPDKPSRWGKLAAEGHHVVQFRDLQTQKYVAVSVDSDVREYGSKSEW